MENLTPKQRAEIEELFTKRFDAYVALERGRERRTWRALVMVMVVMIVLTGLNYFNTVYTSHKICGLIVTFDDAYQNNTPTTPLGAQIRTQMHEFRRSNGC